MDFPIFILHLVLMITGNIALLQVYVFEYKSDQILMEPFIGEQLGSYFGSVLCAADVNNDQLDDIIVGAPYFSTNNTEEGRVYVYINRGMVSQVDINV